MAYVSIWKPVNDRIVEASRNNQDEVIGLLIGRLEDNTIIIEDSITGEFQGEPHRVVLPPNTLAKIADEIVSGRKKGNIIGWYHSHTEIGLGFSETDVQTQKKLQQFSALITAMVVDAKTGDTGYFRVNQETGSINRIPDANVRILGQLAEATKTEMIGNPQTNPNLSTEVPPLPMPNFVWSSTRTIIILVILAVAAGVAVMGLMFYRRFGAVMGGGAFFELTARLTAR